MKIKQPISESLKKQILHLAAHGYGSRNIAIRVDISRSLVRRVLAENLPEDLKSGTSGGSKLAQFQQVINKQTVNNDLIDTYTKHFSKTSFSRPDSTII